MSEIRQVDGPITGHPRTGFLRQVLTIFRFASIPWPPYSSPTPGFWSRGPAQWSTGLCDCSEDCDNCCLTFFCPCITFGRVAEIVDSGSSSCRMRGALYALIALSGCPCLYSFAYRTKLRAHYSLPESPCNDCIVHCCCEPCALCQAYRELQNHDFQMALGWHKNIEIMQGVRMIQLPPMQGPMTR